MPENRSQPSQLIGVWPSPAEAWRTRFVAPHELVNPGEGDVPPDFPAPETWPIIEHEPEHIPVVPPDLHAPSAATHSFVRRVPPKAG